MFLEISQNQAPKFLTPGNEVSIIKQFDNCSVEGVSNTADTLYYFRLSLAPSSTKNLIRYGKEKEKVKDGVEVRY